MKRISIILLLLAHTTCIARAQTETPEIHIAGALCARDPGTTTRRFLPLKQTHVSMDVTAGVIHATVSQRFENDTTLPLEAIYIFPLPSGATVTDMQLQVGERIIRSVVQEREQAKATYEAAKKEGKKTALVEQERPNIFTTSVANFLPGESVTISLSYTETATYADDAYSITFPMVVGQRYVPANTSRDETGAVIQTPAVPDADRLNPPLLHPTVDPDHRLSIDVSLYGLPINEITSTTHAITVAEPSKENEPYTVSLAEGETIPNCEFNIRVALRPHATPQHSFVAGRADDGKTYGLLTVFPTVDPTLSLPRRPRDVIFLIDTSGSMSGESIGQAQSGMKHCLGMLTDQDRFAIVRFSDDYSFFSPALRAASRPKLAEAEGYIDGLTSGGGTEMQPALEYVLRLPRGKGRETYVVFLTDGDVGNEDSLMKLVGARLGNARLFTFAIGSAPNEFLLKKIAKIGRGQARSIRSHEDISSVMSDFFATLDAPVLTDVELEWLCTPDTPAEAIEYYPNPCPDVFRKRPLQVVVKAPGESLTGLRLSGRLNGEPVTYEHQIGTGTDHTFPAISKLFGGRKIDELMFRMVCADTTSEQDILRSNVVATALEHQLVSKFTSRVAVEERIDQQPDGSLVTARVPVPLPRGWSSSAWFATATNDPRDMLIGLVCLSAALLLAKRRRLATQPGDRG